jgi:hypothetical protein
MAGYRRWPTRYAVESLHRLVPGKPWEEEVLPQIVIASADSLAGDVVPFGVIKALGRWNLETGEGDRELAQIRRAIAPLLNTSS